MNDGVSVQIQSFANIMAMVMGLMVVVYFLAFGLRAIN